LAGGVPGPGVVVERFIEVIYIPSQPYEIAKNGKKTGGFPHVLAYKSPQTPFYALKYLTRYTHETFFEEHINFKIFSLLKPLRSYTCSKFRKSYTPPAAQIRVNISIIK
jgi:hypothetical protein